MNEKKALFLDRDGVINIDYGYVATVDRFEFVEGIFDLCRAAKSKGYLIVVVTNQAGIARGYYTEQQFNELTGWMKSRFDREGCGIDGVYFSPYHPEYGIGAYKKATNCRKPNPGMLIQAQQELAVDLSASILIGDNETDIQAAIAAGVGRNLLFRNRSGKEYPLPDLSGVLVINDLSAAIAYL